jgi:hypothetical protein
VSSHVISTSFRRACLAAGQISADSRDAESQRKEDSRGGLALAQSIPKRAEVKGVEGKQKRKAKAQKDRTHMDGLNVECDCGRSNLLCWSNSVIQNEKVVSEKSNGTQNQLERGILHATGG